MDNTKETIIYAHWFPLLSNETPYQGDIWNNNQLKKLVDSPTKGCDNMKEYKFVTHDGYKKENVDTLFMRGGLISSDRTQKVVIDVYEKHGDSDAKVVLHFGIADSKNDDVFVEKPKSLRFNNMGEIQAFINILNRAKLILGNKQGVLNEQAIAYRLSRDVANIHEAYREVAKREG